MMLRVLSSVALLLLLMDCLAPAVVEALHRWPNGRCAGGVLRADNTEHGKGDTWIQNWGK